MHTDKPRVLHVIARYNVGGTARYLNNLLPQLKHEVETLLAVGHVQGDEIEDSSLENNAFVRIEHLGRRINPINDLRAYLELRITVKKFKPQIIHSHTFKAGLLCRLMFFKISKVHTFHGHLMTDPEFSRRALQVIINVERHLAKLTKKLITVGDQVSKDLLNVGVGKPLQYVSVASQTKQLNFTSRESARAQLKLLPDQPIVLWIGRMAPVKNPFLALEVAQLLPDVTFLMGGGGELYDQVKNSAPKNVRALGWVDPENIIPAADLFISTSSNEGIPYTFLEVLSFGLPIVAVKSGAIEEVDGMEVFGTLTKKDPREIADEVKKTLNDLKQNKYKNLKKLEGVDEKAMQIKHTKIYSEILTH